ncbi:hypothetical protein Rleg9DRAFT_7323 [Rhizobium leguminosarum bv. trifolii WSM597]|uniref:Uncharacterized protein n=1 Tax=Rhizobium leguminosarum bv. trifolii WSM597 TaxID=754764 RepID=J0GXC3_RHILT|nr:hypothetical protein [Rhizobium leguminosarum]EJB02290.1 hypothetical protein Rleg9DRAFT_1083 [Rhizobium leguminosarum bv. trifolii WSM597]EJB08278.1 hypothetical protein Rleg9DRAFT_7323 [Rhizobium leguminosarum bv. trifolii WSM597]
MIRLDGRVLEARYELTGGENNFELVLKADGGSGEDRLNPDYGIALKTILHRLAVIDATLTAAYLDSKGAREGLTLEERLLDPKQPCRLSEENTDKLCSMIRRSAASIAVPSAVTSSKIAVEKTGRNTTRRIRLSVSTPVFRSVRAMRTFIENGRISDRPASMRKSEQDIEEGFLAWHAMLKRGEKTGRNTWYFPSHDIRVQIGPRLVDDVPVARFGRGRIGRDWIVEINPPVIPGKENGLTTVALDNFGRRWLLRQGVLHANGVSGRIDGQVFEEKTRLSGLLIEEATRTWYAVEILDSPEGSQPLGTLEFVTRCASARTGEISPAQHAVERYGPAELSASYTLRASQSAEREVTRKQGIVWQDLFHRVQSAGGTLTKPKHALGYEVDAYVCIGSHRLLIEIKTTTAAADVYAGVGQLMIYPGLIAEVAGAKKLLMLPGEIAIPVAETVASCGITIVRYVPGDLPDSPLGWPAETLAALGL